MATSTLSHDPKELFFAISAALPNIANYVRVILKKESLSEEAEAKRQKYEVILTSLEQGLSTGGRPRSILCDDDSGYFSANRNRGGDNPEQLRASTFVSHSGYLLWQDEKLRWHRCWCKAENRDMRFYIYEDNSEEVLVRSFSLEGPTTHFEGPLTDQGKDNCFLITSVLYDAIGGSHEMEASTSPIDVHLAAYTDTEGKKWKEILQQLLLSHDAAKSLLPTLDGNASWLAPVLSRDSASSSSSNFSSNRDSVVSNTSSLVNTFRMSSRSDFGEGREHSLAESLSSKQQQPLPSPPHQVQIPGDDDSMSAHNAYDEDDNISVGTIYESIDNLVLQFDDAIRNMGENIKPGAKSSTKTKKKDRSIFRQHSFLSLRSKNSKSNIWSEKRADFEKGERYSGFMLKKGTSGSWKKKWCVLKGCVFGYYKSRNDTQGRECIILNGTVETNIQDDKKQFVFSLSCTGVHEMFFAVEEEEMYYEWVAKLQTACSSAADYAHALQAEGDETGVNEPSKFHDSIYNVPRALTDSDGQLYDTPRGTPHPVAMTPEAAVDAGIYNVPRNLMMTPYDDSRQVPSEEDAQYLLGTNPLDIYDYPRVSISPDEEGIYDDPLDIIDMEIYDYPPDASELGIEDPFASESARSSTATVSGEFALSDRGSFISTTDWNPLVVPPLPVTARPAMPLTTEDVQNSRNSVNFSDLLYDHPKSQPVAAAPDGVGTAGAAAGTGVSADMTDSMFVEYGQCAMRGYLYKKERFMTWIKLFCIIRNNFLECHKPQGDSYSPVLKLFLPGSEVKEGGGDPKKKWAFQVKHPRREGMLVFAGDSEEDSHKWIRAFQSGASIQVQPVNTVEEIRITDLEMQKRWTTMDKPNTVTTPVPSEDTPAPLPPRRKTYSAGTAPEEFATDTLKRRKKFSWVKSNFMRRKSEKKLMSGSQTDLNSNRLSSSTLSGTNLERMPPHFPDPLRKSVSLELLPTATDSEEDRKSLGSILSDNGFQGYLRVQRRGADDVWVRYWCVLENYSISCYISQRDLTLTLSIQLQGSKVAESEIDCGRKHSFKILHVESGQCLYFAADTNEDFFRWFNEVTRNGHHVVSDDPSSSFGPFLSYYAIPKDPIDIHNKRLSVVSEGGSSNISEASSTAAAQPPNGSVFYRGQLLKASHTGKWKQRYCVVNNGTMGIFHSSGEKTPITSIPLQGISLELITTSLGSKNEYQFQVNPPAAAKSHTFSAPNETEMYAWISALRDASSAAPPAAAERSTEGASSSPVLPGKLSRRKSKKLKNADLISYVAASSIQNPDYSGFADIQYGTEPWAKYWCVACSNCLYIYQNQLSQSTTKTVVLLGYEVVVGELHSTKYTYNLSLHHEGVSPVRMSVRSQEELDMWAAVLEKYTRVEGNAGQKKISSKLLASETPAKIKVSSKNGVGGSKKGPVKADHKISGVKQAIEEVSGSSESLPTTSSKQESLQRNQDATVRQYEKRIRKTRRVADQTEQKLKKQQASLLHFKKELSRHVIKLQELSKSGDPQAQKRLKNVRMKLIQLDKIVPYLGKYIAVNRQAEMQTIAVLKESCTVELRKLSQGKGKPGEQTSTTQPDVPAQAVSQQQPDRVQLGRDSPTQPVPPDRLQLGRDSPAQPVPLPQQPDHVQLGRNSPAQPAPQPHGVDPPAQPAPQPQCDHGVDPPAQPDRVHSPAQQPAPQDQPDHVPGSSAQPPSHPPPTQPSENPYASLSEIRKDRGNPVKLRTNYAELDFERIRGSDNVRPPSVKYSEVRINAMGIGRVVPDVTTTAGAVRGSKSANPQASSPETLPAELNIAEQTSGSDSPLHDVTITPDNVGSFAKEATEEQNDSQQESNIAEAAAIATAPLERSVSPPSPPKRSDSISTERRPPPVLKKPASRHKPPEQVKDSDQLDGGEKAEESMNPGANLPSVMDRIKALQQQ